MHDHPVRAAGGYLAPGTQLHSIARKRSLVSTAVAFALACAAGSVTNAVAAPAPEPQAQTTASETPSSDESPQLAEVVVTGSRIARRDFEANSPITTVQSELLENSSSFALETKLLQLPQFSGAGNSQYATGYFNSGAATLNLRNLGDNRNLVLLDGRRLQPSTSALAIDINTIPAALIDSVEVITGGASAAYGADAVSGVVNFKACSSMATTASPSALTTASST
jgi:iron complex outermembrane recepter protein